MRHTERPQRAPPGETPARTTSDGAVQQQHQPSTFGDRTLVASSAQAGSSRDLSTSLMRRVSSSKGKERADAASPDVAAAAHDTFELDASFKHALSPLSSSRASLASVDRPASAPGAFDLVSEFADRGVRHHGREGNDASPSSPTRSTRLPSPPPKPSYPYLERPDSAPPHATAPGLLSAASTSFSQPVTGSTTRVPSPTGAAEIVYPAVHSPPSPSAHRHDEEDTMMADSWHEDERLALLVSILLCPACDELLDQPTTLSCGHSVCYDCAVPPASMPSLASGLPAVATESLFARNPSTPQAIAGGMERSLTSTSVDTDGGDVPRDSFGLATTRALGENPDATLRSGTDASPTVSSPRSSAARRRLLCPCEECPSRQEARHVLASQHKIDRVLANVVSLVRAELAELEAASSPAHSSSSATSAGYNADDEAKRMRASEKWRANKRRRNAEELNQPTIVRTAYQLHARDNFWPAVVGELECQVCYQLVLEPKTTPCGHTFCHKCLTRALDHSDKCPLCRSDFPGHTYFQKLGPNAVLNKMTETVFSEDLDERKAAFDAEMRRSAGSCDTPLFVCGLAWPNMPLFLHVFEPRYRLMTRRVMETNQLMGIVLPARQSGGVTQFGTMVRVTHRQMLEDGRSILETVGLYRFKILERTSLDGYTLARVQRLDDLSPELEQQLETAAMTRRNRNGNPLRRITLPRRLSPRGNSPPTMSSSAGSSSSSNPPGGADFANLPAAGNPAARNLPADEDLDSMSKEDMMAYCREFVQMLRSGSAPWVLQRLNSTIGPMPTNPADFSWWMAEIVPTDDHVKAILLEITSPRERLRLLCFWIKEFRASWWFSRGCTIM